MVVGEPASGKTTLIKKAFNPFSFPEQFRYGLVRGVKNGNLLILGVWQEGETFCGCDKLSMGVNGTAKALLKDIKDNGFNLTLVCDGDRLYNNSFMDKAIELGYEVIVFEVQASKEVKDARHHDRGDTQSEGWLKGRKTKVDNMRAKYLNKVNYQVLMNESALDLNLGSEKIRLWA